MGQTAAGKGVSCRALYRAAFAQGERGQETALMTVGVEERRGGLAVDIEGSSELSPQVVCVGLCVENGAFGAGFGHTLNMAQAQGEGFVVITGEALWSSLAHSKVADEGIAVSDVGVGVVEFEPDPEVGVALEF